jgi:hypothetical protein
MKGIALASLLVLSSICAADPSRAQAAPDADLGEKAVEIGRDGLALFEKGEFEEARARFAAADALSPSPVFRLYEARCLRHTARLLAARAAYSKIRSEEARPQDPRPWGQARIDARAELAALEAIIPAVRISLRHDEKAGQAKKAVVTIDEKEVEVDTRIEVDPGEHVVVVTIGERVRTERFTIAEGSGELALAIDLSAPKPTSPAPPAARESPEQDVPPSVYAGGALLGLGAASLVAGVVTGALALSRSDEVVSICGDEDACPKSRRTEVEPLVEESMALGHTSTGTLITGGALSVTGLILVLVKPGGAPARAGAWVAPSLGGLVISGRF